MMMKKSNIKLFFTDTMSILFIFLSCHNHLIIVRVVGEQFPSFPRITDRTVKQDTKHQRSEKVDIILNPLHYNSARIIRAFMAKWIWWLTLQVAGLTRGDGQGRAIATLPPDALWSLVTKCFLQSGQCCGRSGAASLMAKKIVKFKFSGAHTHKVSSTGGCFHITAEVSQIRFF